MKTPAAIASLTVVGSLAFATATPSGTTPTRSQQRTETEDATSGSHNPPNLAAGPCVPQSAEWFAATPRTIGRCINPLPVSSSPNYSGLVGVVPLGACDVNNDGAIEFFDGLGEVPIFGFPTGTTSHPILLKSEEQAVGTSTLLVHTVLLRSSEALALALRAMEPSVSMGDSWLRPYGWRDMDRDGDLDLVCVFGFRGGGTVDVSRRDIWFENIGFEQSPPLAADLNNDGIVDGADLGILLSVWGEPN
jgi:hypothetical protein